MSEKLKSLNTQCFCPVNKTNKQNLGYLFSFIEKKKRKLHHKWSVSAFSHEPCRVPPERMQWILLSENWSPLTVLPPSIRGAGDLCRPQPTGEQSACVSFCPGVSFFCLDHILYCVWSLIVCSVSRVEAFTVDPSRQSSAIAAKAQCRPLTWWMVPDNKTLGFTFSLSCHSSADSGWPAELRTLRATSELFTSRSTTLQQTER